MCEIVFSFRFFFYFFLPKFLFLFLSWLFCRSGYRRPFCPGWADGTHEKAEDESPYYSEENLWCPFWLLLPQNKRQDQTRSKFILHGLRAPCICHAIYTYLPAEYWQHDARRCPLARKLSDRCQSIIIHELPENQIKKKKENKQRQFASSMLSHTIFPKQRTEEEHNESDVCRMV